MSKTPIHHEDGSSLRDEPQKERPFNHPNSAYESHEEVDSTGEESADSDRVSQNSRLAMIEEIAARAEEDRAIQAGTRQEDMPMGEPVPREEDPDDLDPEDEGLQSRERMHEEEDPDALPEEYQDDPLAEFIVMDGDEPMFRTVVEGREQFIPLEKARAQLQKNMAADRRLQEASEATKRAEERIRAAEAREAEVERKLKEMHATPLAPQASAEQNDEALVKEAREVVAGFFTGSEDEAAAKLVSLLKKNRGAVDRATPGIDIEELEQRAVAAARRELSEEQRQKDVQTGYKKFVEDYPEVAADDDLFRFADSMTDAIAAEHPEWMPSEVMLEAGARARKWVEKQKAPKQEPTSTKDRVDRKRQLRPIPRARTGSPPREAAEPSPETPSDVLSDIKKARGQVV